ncbi:zinc metalloprotease HtpX [Austwickia chelonae]|uniref:zinc metalloprotease HtpX n=1 Tax=Austwickia chelonae TaxID=100225 RepID=UPI000E265301|nr:zinc metalloprotease HtpX [Austwickia chelonae]
MTSSPLSGLKVAWKWRSIEGVHVSSVVTLLAAAPWTALGFVAFTCIGMVVDLVRPGSGETVLWSLILVWAFSGLLALQRAGETILAKVLFGWRRPTPGELAQLAPAWQAVTARAGVDPSRYSLWIADLKYANAAAAGGHMISVTTGAMKTLKPTQLEAVLAHELGHHRAGHTWSTLLAVWYAMPGRWVARLTTWGFRQVLGVAARHAVKVDLSGNLLAVVKMLSLLLPVWAALLVMQIVFAANPAWLLVPVIPLAAAFFNRYAELYADSFAVSIGYGPLLREVLEQFQEAGCDQAAEEAGVRAALFATHPTCKTRILGIERQLASREGQHRD